MCNETIDPMTELGKLAKEENRNQFLCIGCQTKSIEDIRMRLEGPQSDYTKQIIYKRMREMEEGQVHIIGTYPEDKFARIEDEKCGSCCLKEAEDRILESSPNSIDAEHIIKKRFAELETKLEMDTYMSNLKSGKSNAHFFKSKGMRKPMRDVYY